MEIVNERLLGWMVPLVHDFGDEAIAEFNFPANVYKEGLSITHSKYGLLVHEPQPVSRTIDVTMELHRRHKTIHVPADGRKRPKYKYEVDEVETERKIIIGDALEDADIISRVTEAENRRSRKQAAKDYDQQWFHRKPVKAEKYVREEIIGQAHDMVLIVDPYFAGPELFRFGHAIRRQEVQLRILTSAQGLKKGGNGESNRKSGSQLLKILNDTFKVEYYSTKPEIRILTGESPSVHDRFLVVDGSVWLSGNSLHTIGERASMILRLPDPEPVIELLEDFWYKAPTLSDWLSNQPSAGCILEEDSPSMG